MGAMIYCGECRETGLSPWDHKPGCSEGEWERFDVYTVGVAGVIVAVLAETVWLLVLVVKIGAVL